ncbi:class I SAM-dependent methyltransferase [Capnocytophaga felis]|uniref:Tetracenomycin C synthesis protein n=1 Tax=Capnocytophaga felis TaxID=2267611 RepID=A0A5M4B9H9_9FLAO|nr:class I SAM-dependent methyltransferase [Capnocytophaga felis]GET46238.1 hypothetical protein RCZ01_15400 [Capnocytophaga felis]GET48223.1 hypothetical protein RCZ02_10540 [Capnocytophaga felis]
MSNYQKINVVQLGNISETMLITLWAKAAETKHSQPVLYDEKAVEIVGKIDYDFSKFKRVNLSQLGVCVRAKLIDNEVKRFIKKFPDAVIIQLGAGLDARYQRLGNPPITHWYDLDLEEVITVRKKFIEPTEKNTFLSMSLFDNQWIEKVKSHNKPVFVIAEGVLMYFEEKEIRSFFENLCTNFQELTVVFDMLFYKGVGRAKRHATLKTMKNVPEFKWSLLNTHDMEKWHKKIHIEKEYYMSDFYGKRLPFFWRLLYKIPYVYKNLNQRVVRLKIK